MYKQGQCLSRTEQKWVNHLPQRRTVPSSDADRHCCALDLNATLCT